MRMKSKLIIVLSALLLLCSCAGAKKQQNLSDDPELNSVVVGYLDHFNDIYKWEGYASDDFIARVYMWCSGDASGSKTIDEMKDLYAEISKERASLTDYEIKEMAQITAGEYEVAVDRSWDNGTDDSTTYSVIKMDGLWKIDNRF
jgi:hypothetical protein